MKAWRQSWSCDQDHLNKLLFPDRKAGSILNLSLIDPVVSEEMFKVCGYQLDDDGLRRTPAYATSFGSVGCDLKRTYM